MAMAQCLSSTCSTGERQHRGPEEMASASSIVDGLVKASSWLRKFEKSKGNKIGSVPNMTPYMDRLFFARGTLPPIASPAAIMLVRNGRLAN
jgi:hypothetical protein